MGCNVMKMCTGMKPDPKFNCLVNLNLLQLYKSHGQNKNISINSAQEDFSEATLNCNCRMKECPSIGFFIVARGWSSNVIMFNGHDIQDLLAMRTCFGFYFICNELDVMN